MTYPRGKLKTVNGSFTNHFTKYLSPKLLNKLKKSSNIKVGTDCSGIETPMMALELLSKLSGDKLQIDHIFSSEIGKNLIEFIERNFQPKIIYRDLKQRNLKEIKKIPQLDLYIAGFPCQSFSSSGVQRGFDDDRGQIFFYIHDFIKINNPRAFILENVSNLQHHDKGNTWNIIMTLLSDLPYKIYTTTLDVKDYGIPQSRNRVFIVGIHQKEKCNFEFPNHKLPNISIDNLLYDKCLHNTTLSQREQNALEDMFTYDDNLRNNPDENWVMNLDVSDYTRGRRYIDYSPCLYTSCKYFLLKYNRHIYPEEALRLQGITPELYDWSMFSDKQIYSAAGNAIGVNVLTFLLLNVLNCLIL